MMITAGRFIFFGNQKLPPHKKFGVWRLLDVSIIKNGASGGGAKLSPKESPSGVPPESLEGDIPG